MANEPLLFRAVDVPFLSALDEAQFFRWAKGIDGVAKVFGEGRAIVLVMRSRSLSDEGLRELTALFYRYGVELRQVARAASRVTHPWFFKTRRYWHRRAFGRGG